MAFVFPHFVQFNPYLLEEQRRQRQLDERALAVAAARRLLAEEEERTRRAEHELAVLIRRIQLQRQQRILVERRVQQLKPSLREQLETRLYSDESAEIRDTIHAIFASLADAKPESKGKAKAKAEPLTRDLAHAFDVVKSIAAAFTSLENEFIFPAKLDLDSASSTPAKLAFTANNHPIKYYEQSLTALLLQLDQVDSFGNEQLRSLRKEIVDRVEKALDELEREVEGRWRAKQRKEDKSVQETQQVQESIQQVESIVQPVTESSTQPIELVDQPVIEPVDQPAAESTKVESVAQPVTESSTQLSELVEQPVTEPADQPAAESTKVESVAQPTDPESTEKFVAVPEPVDQPSSQVESAVQTESHPIPYDVQSTEPVSSDDESASEIDTFLQPATHEETKKDDVDSDWSEVDA